MSDPDRAGAGVSRTIDVESLTSAVLQRWRQQLRRSSDDCPRSGDRGESERQLVGALLRASSSKDDTLLPGLAAAAAQYGAGQRRDKLDPGGLCDELSCLRQIVWSELKSGRSDVKMAIDRILRFDRALSIVVKAALRAGYEQKAFASAPCTQDEGGDNGSSALRGR